MGLTRLWSDNQQITESARRGMRYIEAYECPQSSFRADVAETLVMDSIHPEESGFYAAQLRRIKVTENWKAGLAHVLAIWEPPPLHKILERYPNKAVLKMKLSEVREKAIGDDEGKYLVNEPYWADDDKYKRWVPVTGGEFVFKGRMDVVLETATDSLHFITLKEKINKVNQFYLPNFGNAQPETLLFRGAETIFRYLDRDLTLMWLVFTWEPGGWNLKRKTKRQVLAARTVLADGDSPSVTVRTWEDDGTSHEHQDYEAVSFQDINAMIEWA